MALWWRHQWIAWSRSVDPKILKGGGSPDSDQDFLWPSGQSGKGWVEQEFVLLIVAALPSEAGLPNE